MCRPEYGPWVTLSPRYGILVAAEAIAAASIARSSREQHGVDVTVRERVSSPGVGPVRCGSPALFRSRSRETSDDRRGRQPIEMRSIRTAWWPFGSGVASTPKLQGPDSNSAGVRRSRRIRLRNTTDPCSELARVRTDLRECRRH
jgi:hypothetical protein